MNSMSQKMDNLTNELEVVKTKKETNTNEISSEQTIKCNLYEYTASTKMKHMLTFLPRPQNIFHQFHYSSV